MPSSNDVHTGIWKPVEVGSIKPARRLDRSFPAYPITQIAKHEFEYCRGSLIRALCDQIILRESPLTSLLASAIGTVLFHCLRRSR